MGLSEVELVCRYLGWNVVNEDGCINLLTPTGDVLFRVDADIIEKVGYFETAKRIWLQTDLAFSMEDWNALMGIYLVIREKHLLLDDTLNIVSRGLLDSMLTHLCNAILKADTRKVHGCIVDYINVYNISNENK